jgi:hypothetical protein
MGWLSAPEFENRLLNRPVISLESGCRCIAEPGLAQQHDRYRAVGDAPALTGGGFAGLQAGFSFASVSNGA